MKPLILVTNDDGVQAKGINCLIEGIRDLGNIVVVAPDGPRSGMSSAISAYTPLKVRKEQEEENLTVYSCNGTPVDCVKLAVGELLDQKPALLLSGINHGSNAAISMVYSGTMGAAIEGAILGINSIGLSLTDHDHDADFSVAVKYAQEIASKVLNESLPQGVCLNVNVPNIESPKGIKICSQTKGQWVREFKHEHQSNGERVFKLTGYFQNEEPHNKQSDEWALTQGFVAVVPTQIDMTKYEYMQKIKHWEM